MSKNRPARRSPRRTATLRLLFDANPEPMWIYDRETLAFLAVNKAAINKYGYSQGEFLNMKITEIRPPGDIPRLRKFLARIKEGLHYTGEWRHILKSGRLIDVEISTYPLLWRGREAVLVSTRDITRHKRIEEALIRAEERLGALIANAPIILFATDQDGVITLSEGKGLELLGRRPRESVGRSVFDLYGADSSIAANIKRALSGETFAAEVELKGVLFETRYAPLFGEAGLVAGVIGVATDVTHRQRESRLVRQQGAAMRAALDGVAILDDRGEYLYLNEAHARVYGYDRPEELVGRTWRVLYGPVELERFEKVIMPALALAGRWRGEAVGRRRDASLFPQEVSLTRIEGGGLVCVIRDITERKLAEEEHARLLLLEKTAREEAEASSRAKDEFLALVSHELRTPMTAIMGWIWLLREGGVGEADQSKALEHIERNMRLQHQIIEDLLDISAIVAGKVALDLHPVDLARVVLASADSVRPAAQAKRVTVSFEGEGGVPALWDARRLQQVFSNLLSNAVKFSREGGPVRVRLRQEGGKAVAEVEDEGEGIAPDFLPNLFDPFHQGENPLIRHYRGLGIGLAIVKRLVEMHGGTVSAASRGLDRGATFTVTLPAVQAASASSPSSAASGDALPPGAGAPKAAAPQLEGSLKGLRILLVDDEADTLVVLSALLRHCGAEVLTAGSAPEALALFMRQKPDVLVSDVAMPGEDGYSLLGKVRALGPSRGGDVCAVALTAYARDEDRTRSLAAGYQAYLSKPVEPSELVAALRGLIRGS